MDRKPDLDDGDLLLALDGRVFRATGTPDGGLTIEPVLTADDTRVMVQFLLGGSGGGQSVCDCGRRTGSPRW